MASMIRALAIGSGVPWDRAGRHCLTGTGQHSKQSRQAPIYNGWKRNPLGFIKCLSRGLARTAQAALQLGAPCLSGPKFYLSVCYHSQRLW